MWILRNAPASPFGRKVRIAAALCGLDSRIEIVIADTADPADPLRGQNPLGKIPTLILEDGTVLYDSRVIVEFLDTQAGGGIIIPPGAPRFPALIMQALADGVMDASLLRVYEGRSRACHFRGESACSLVTATCRSDRARLRAWLPGPALRGKMAQYLSTPRRLA